MSQVTLEYIAPGTRIIFGYHHAIGRNRVYREKEGVVVRTVKHRRGTFYNQPEVVVKFDDNKSNTRVEISRVNIANQSYKTKQGILGTHDD